MSELSFLELRTKEIVNCIDGKKLGRIIDLVFSGETGKIKGIIAPFCRKGFFFKSQDIYIPWSCVKKIGEDVIIVEVPEFASKGKVPEPPPQPSPGPPPCPPGAPPPGMPECDGRCEKCMLFDCTYRWQKCMNRGGCE